MEDLGIIQAIRKGNVNLVRSILSKKVKDPEMISKFVYSYMHTAKKTDRFFNPILLAVSMNQIEILDLLLSKYQIDLNKSLPSEYNSEETTRCLLVAIENGNLNTVNWLLENGASPDLNVPASGNSFLDNSIKTFNYSVTRKLLNYSVASINHYNSNGLTPLNLATRYGHIELVKLLLEYKADINLAERKTGFSPIHLAAIQGHSHLIQLFCETYPATAKVLNKDHSTHVEVAPIHLAAREANSNCVSTLLRFCEANLLDSDGNSPLNYCFSKEHDKSYMKPLSDYEDTIKQLVRHGADARISNSQNESAIDLARKNNFLQMVDYLVQHRRDSALIKPSTGLISANGFNLSPKINSNEPEKNETTDSINNNFNNNNSNNSKQFKPKNSLQNSSPAVFASVMKSPNLEMIDSETTNEENKIKIQTYEKISKKSNQSENKIEYIINENYESGLNNNTLSEKTPPKQQNDKEKMQFLPIKSPILKNLENDTHLKINLNNNNITGKEGKKSTKILKEKFEEKTRIEDKIENNIDNTVNSDFNKSFNKKGNLTKWFEEQAKIIKEKDNLDKVAPVSQSTPPPNTKNQNILIFQNIIEKNEIDLKNAATAKKRPPPPPKVFKKSFSNDQNLQHNLIKDNISELSSKDYKSPSIESEDLDDSKNIDNSSDSQDEFKSVPKPLPRIKPSSSDEVNLSKKIIPTEKSYKIRNISTSNRIVNNIQSPLLPDNNDSLQQISSRISKLKQSTKSNSPNNLDNLVHDDSSQYATGVKTINRLDKEKLKHSSIDNSQFPQKNNELRSPKNNNAKVALLPPKKVIKNNLSNEKINNNSISNKKIIQHSDSEEQDSSDSSEETSSEEAPVNETNTQINKKIESKNLESDNEDSESQDESESGNSTESENNVTLEESKLNSLSNISEIDPKTVKQVVVFKNSDKKLGFSIVGGNYEGIFVNTIVKNSKSELIPGDELLEVDGKSILGKTKEETFRQIGTVQSDKVVLKIRKNEAKYQEIMKNCGSGDKFYVRSRFIHDSGRKKELKIREGDVYCVTDTLPDKYDGLWKAQKITGIRKNEETIGFIPNRTAADQIMLKHHLSSSFGSGGLFLRSFRRTKSAERLSQKQKLNETADMFNNSLSVISYERVEQITPRYKRPVIILGLFCDVVIGILVKDLPGSYFMLPPNVKIEPVSGLPGPPINVKLLQEIMQSQPDKQLLLILSPICIEYMTNKACLDPIVVFISPVSKAVIKNVKAKLAPNFGGNPSLLYEETAKFEKNFIHLFAATVSYTTDDWWFFHVKETITQLQQQPVWVSEDFAAVKNKQKNKMATSNMIGANAKGINYNEIQKPIKAKTTDDLNTSFVTKNMQKQNDLDKLSSAQKQAQPNPFPRPALNSSKPPKPPIKEKSKSISEDEEYTDNQNSNKGKIAKSVNWGVTLNDNKVSSNGTMPLKKMDYSPQTFARERKNELSSSVSSSNNKTISTGGGMSFVRPVNNQSPLTAELNASFDSSSFQKKFSAKRKILESKISMVDLPPDPVPRNITKMVVNPDSKETNL